MKNLFLSVSLLLVAGLGLSGPARGDPGPASREGVRSGTVRGQSASLQAEEPNLIQADETGIRLRIRNQPLGNVLRAIHARTGIRFQVKAPMMQAAVTASIQASDWKTALRELFQDYNYLEVWAGALDQSQILLIGYRGGREPPLFSPPGDRVFPPAVPTRVANSRPHPARAVPLSQVPRHILSEPGVMAFLQSAGAEIPEKVVKKYRGPHPSPVGNLPPSPEVFSNPLFRDYLESQGIEPPAGFAPGE